LHVSRKARCSSLTSTLSTQKTAYEMKPPQSGPSSHVRAPMPDATPSRIIVPNGRPSSCVPAIHEVADPEVHDAKICAPCNGSSDASSMRDTQMLTAVRAS